MGIVPIIGLIFWLADSTGDINGFILTCFMEMEFWTKP